jgi:hypothetical protein
LLKKNAVGGSPRRSQQYKENSGGPHPLINEGTEWINKREPLIPHIPHPSSHNHTL